MILKNASMLKKIVLSMLPIVAGTLFVSWGIKQTASKKDTQLAKALEMTNLVIQSELEMVKMSEALRGYLLAPENKNEFKRKKAADEAYSQNAAALSILSQGYTEIIELNEKMAAYDEVDLDRIENEVATLIQSQDPKALEYYLKTYIPAREIQTENFSKLKNLVFQKSQEIISEIEVKKQATAHWTFSILLLSVFSGLGIVLWMTRSLVQKVDSISQKISMDVSHIDGVAVGMVNSSQKLSASTVDQASSMQETAASLEEITAMVSKASDSAKKSAKYSLDAQEKTQAGRNSMKTLLSSISEVKSNNSDIVTEVQSSGKQMEQVIEIIKAIGNKTRVINEIVFQTKLLSFNASVEAARAGEHGNGFSVVATEVGNLAQMSGNAALEITDMLAQSITKVEEIVKSSQMKTQSLMDGSKAKFERSVDVANQCSETFGEIAASVDGMAQLAQEISHATGEQSQGLAEINKAMGQLDTATQISATEGLESATGAETLAQQTQSLRNAVSELSRTINGRAHNQPPTEETRPPKVSTALGHQSDDQAA